jgi:hypothetical protein
VIESLHNIHLGERIFLIGNGLSLSAKDLDLIKGEYSFGVNYINKIYDKTEWRPSFYAWFDTRYAKHEDTRGIVETNIGSNVPVFLRDGMFKDYINPNIYRVKLLRRGNPVPDPFKREVYGWGTVLMPASHLALFMGFKELVFMGCCLGFDREQHHFYPDAENSYSGDVQKECEAFIRVVHAHKIIAGLAKTYRADVFNATRGGQLGAHPRVRLEDIL